MKDYIVTLRSYEDLDAFYNDMETAGGPSTCPQREVECCCRRPVSRNTHYKLDAAEAEALKADPRVLDVAFDPNQFDFHKHEKRGGWTQTNTEFNKSNFLSPNFVNWGLLRSYRQEQIAGWGADNTQTITTEIQSTTAGRNVDVVIVDGFLEIDHPQISENLDGTGNSRFTQFDWGQFRPQVDGGAAFTYTYTNGQNNLNNGNDNHGIHVVGTVCGNAQGFAREANIFNIVPYGNSTDPSDPYSQPNDAFGASGTTCYDYIRVWMSQKAVNNEIGVRNPTIVNNSWGSAWSIAVSAITQVIFQGVTNNGPFTQVQLEGFGFTTFFTFGNDHPIWPNELGVSYEDWDTAAQTDLEDLIDEGAIVIGAAGNSEYLIDVPGGINYDNRVLWTAQAQNFDHFYHRGSSNVTGVNGITVGAMNDDQVDEKVGFSNTGPRIDVWAPGNGIMSSVAGNALGGGQTTITVPDPLNNGFNLTKYNGTSMASPQVCGVLANWLELNPRANHEDALRFLQQQASRPDQLAPGTNGGFQDTADLQGAPRSVLCYHYQRPSSVGPTPGSRTLLPHDGQNARPTEDAVGMLYPRTLQLLTPQATGGGWTGTITLSSPDFTDGSALDNQFWFANFGCPGQNDSPALVYSITGDAPPAGATWTINCTDLDGGPFLHWSVTNIPSFYRNIQQNEDFSGAAGSTPQANDWGQPGQDGNRANGWGGPCPPGGTGLHRYQFQVTLVDDQGATLGTSNVYTSEITA